MLPAAVARPGGGAPAARRVRGHDVLHRWGGYGFARAGGGFHVAQHARDAVGQRLVAELLAKALHHQRKGQRPGSHERLHHELLRLHACERRQQLCHVQLLAQHFLVGLAQQQVARVITPKDLEEQLGRRLQLARTALLARVALKDEPRHARNLAKAPARHLGGVEAGQHLVQQLCAATGAQ